MDGGYTHRPERDRYSSSEGATPPQLVVVASGSSAGLCSEETLTRVAAAPAEIMLQAARPNPFRSTITIQYSLPAKTPVRLVLYDVTGRAVRTLVDGIEVGDRRAIWDGTDQRGARVPPGVYLVRLDAEGKTLTRKISMVK